MTFQKATRKKVKLKTAITGPSGGGKTYSALRLARGLAGTEGKIAFIDTENRSASLYADRFDFDVMDIEPPFNDSKFINAIDEAVKAGYDALVIDSGSHFWEGILEWKSALDDRGGNSYMNWNQAGKKFKGILDAVLQSPIHVICCMRSKMDYVLEANAKGKQEPKKVGLAPIMRDGSEYEYTVVFDVDLSHHAKTSKDRTGLFLDNIFQITEATGTKLKEWLESGADFKDDRAEKSTALAVDLARQVAETADLAALMNLKPQLTAAKENLTVADLKLVTDAFNARKNAHNGTTAAA